MSNIVELPQPSFSGKSEKPAPPRKPRNADVRSREYLTPKEVDKLLATARKLGRHGHRDRTLTLVMYRHGLRVSDHQIPQRTLGHVSPIQALKEWQKKRPDLFVKRVYNVTGLDAEGVPPQQRKLVAATHRSPI